jgi:cell division septation protein DedD
MSAMRIFATCALALTLGACSTDYLVERYEWRWGPDPAIPRSDVQTVIGGQIQVLDYITYQAFGVHYPPPPPVPSQFWFEVTEWGFNVGRQDCEIYLDYMFRMNREKQRDDGIIAGVSAASSAIVAATTHNPAKALSVLAASFGLATALNDAIFESYLFSEAPGLISVKVKDLQDTYQQQVEKNQVQTPKIVSNTQTKTTTTTSSITKPPSQATDTTTAVVAPISTPAAAYNAIQNYYHICLPHSIEGVLLQAVADSSAKPSSPSTSSTPALKGNTN